VPGRHLKIKRGKKQPGINFRYPPRHISPLGLGSVDRMRGPAKKIQSISMQVGRGDLTCMKKQGV